MFSPRQISFKSETPVVSLPVKLSAKEAEENPDFVQLLTDLRQSLTEDGLSMDVQKDLQQAEDTLRHEKHNWLQASILYRELQDIVFDYDIRSRDTSLSVADQEFKEILEQSLNYAEASDYLAFTPDPSSKVTLLGITPDDIQESNPYKKHLPSLQQKLIPELEDRLRRRCENLVSVFHTSTLGDSDTLAMAKSTQLPALVERTQRVVEEEKQRLRVARVKREKQFWTYFQTLLDSLGMLENMIKGYRLEKQDRTNTVTSEALIARCDAMCLKIKFLELQILCDTYTAETVAALNKVKQELNDVTAVKERDLHRVKMALQAYTAVGYGFDQLAEEYSNLVRELENKEWALDELGKSLK